MLDIGPRPASDRTEGMRTTSPWRLLPPMMIGLALWAARADAQDAAAGSAATEGVATTIESRGDKPGCVDWTYRVVPAPRNRQLRKVRLEFDFVNRCGREVSVVPSTDSRSCWNPVRSRVTSAPGRWATTSCSTPTETAGCASGCISPTSASGMACTWSWRVATRSTRHLIRCRPSRRIRRARRPSNSTPLHGKSAAPRKKGEP